MLGAQPLWTVNNLPLFTLGGFTFITTRVGIFGADSGRFVQGIVDLNGNGYPGGDVVMWQFTAPPYDITHFDHNITGPITLMFLAFRETGHVPDGGGTLMPLVVGVIALFSCKQLRIPLNKSDAVQRLRFALTARDFLVLNAHRVFVRFYFAPSVTGIDLSELGAEEKDL